MSPFAALERIRGGEGGLIGFMSLFFKAGTSGASTVSEVLFYSAI